MRSVGKENSSSIRYGMAALYLLRLVGEGRFEATNMLKREQTHVKGNRCLGYEGHIQGCEAATVCI